MQLGGPDPPLFVPREDRSSQSEELRQEAGVPNLVSYDVHLECVLQELTAYVRSLECETVEENNKIKVADAHQAMINRLTVEGVDRPTERVLSLPRNLEHNLSRVVEFD